MTLVKVCGLCRPEDAAAAARAGARYLGVILSAGGPRVQHEAGAAAVLHERGGASAVGVFVDEDPARISALADTLSLDVVQLHGAESPAIIGALRRVTHAAVWKAIRVADTAAARAAIARYAAHVDGILLDGWSSHAAGGTGTGFEWQGLAGLRAQLPPRVQLIVAGGLDADNVTAAIAVLEPDVVDVSSGVEVRPGEKSEERVRAFIDRARLARKEAAG